jgi:hypothetical protein
VLCLFSVEAGRGLLLEDAEHVLFPQDEVVLAVELDLGAGVLAEQHGVTGLDVQGAELAVLEELAVAHGHHVALERLLLGGLRDEQAALGLVLLCNALDNKPILKKTNLHNLFPLFPK